MKYKNKCDHSLTIQGVGTVEAKGVIEVDGILENPNLEPADEGMAHQPLRGIAPQQPSAPVEGDKQ